MGRTRNTKKKAHVLNTRLLTYNIKVGKSVWNRVRYLLYNDKQACAVIITNLLACIKKHNKLVYSRNTRGNGSVKTKVSTYQVMRAIDFLSREEYIINHKGKPHKNPDKREISYVEPTQKFVDRFVNTADIVDAAIAYMEDCSVIELRDDETKDPVDFDWTESLKKQADIVRKLNKMNESCTITTESGELLTNIYCRIFNGDFVHGGRYYRADILRINNKEDQRLDVLIDGEPVVEVDFCNLHFRMAAIMNDMCMDYLSMDVYTNILEDENNLVDRRLIKVAVNIMFNAESEESARKAIQQQINALSKEEKEVATLLNAKAIMKLIFDEYDDFSFILCRMASYGKELQYHDSEIASVVLDKMIEAGVVCLPVHDSFVVQAKHRQFLCDTMCNAFREYLNYNGEVFVKVCERLSDGSTRKEIQSW